MIKKQPQSKQNTNPRPKQERGKPFPAMEEEVLNFWDKNKIFEKSVKREAPQGDYVFYDGPPFATGTPHYGHIVASIMKDVVPRYWTMKGYKVERKWGWDCHGLPIENIVEKEMKTKSKKDIEEMGIDKFNESCRSKVLTYVDEWRKVIRRLGRWADMDNAYKTMDKDYMESIWWVFSELYKKGLIYEGYKSMHICPRCETTLSQQEVAEGYKDVKDLSVIAKFELKNSANLQTKYKFTNTDKIYILAWTTTPWTLIGNVSLAVGGDIEYSVCKVVSPLKDLSQYETPPVMPTHREFYIVAKDRKDLLLGEYSSEEAVVIKGKDLVGLEYEPLFNYYSKNKNLENSENGWKIYAADFVTTDEGTGVVHIAPAFGEDDMNLGKQENLPFIQHIGMDGRIKDEAKDFAGMEVKPIDDEQATDVEIIKYLAKKNLLFSKEKYEHSYPHCWRCETPLLNYATSSWFVKVTDIKDKAMKLAKEINWTPGHLKEGRFGQWLEGARDWSISRQRFWASPIPIWRCGGAETRGIRNNCHEIKVIGSVAELENLSGEKIKDLHKHVVDKITFKCEKCGGTMKRIPDVLDCWFESGSMPYAQKHYPFENKKEFENNFPAEFIAEGVDQTRAWFYYLHVIAVAIKQKPAFKNVIANGIVLAEDGKKMAKRLQNYPDPMEIMEKYGADKLRYYLCSGSVVKAEDLNFSEREMAEQTRFFNVLLNVLSFYKMFATSSCHSERLERSGRSEESSTVNLQTDSSLPAVAQNDKRGVSQDDKKQGSDNVLDIWITARMEETKKIITEKMDNYDLHAIREIPVFIDDLSTWYIRRSRDRFKGDDAKDKQNALATTKYVLIELAKVMAPFMPFTAEQVWQKVTGNDFKDENKSVHLESWPILKSEKTKKDQVMYGLQYTSVLLYMRETRKIVEFSLAKRDEAGIKVRQPLQKLKIQNSIISKFLSKNEYLELIKDEVNVKEIEFIDGKGELSVELDIKITPELKQEGIKRELVRAINNARKEAGMTIQDRAVIYYQTDSKDIKEAFEKFGKEIMKDTLADDLQVGSGEAVKINSEEVDLKVEKK